MVVFLLYLSLNIAVASSISDAILVCGAVVSSINVEWLLSIYVVHVNVSSTILRFAANFWPETEIFSPGQEQEHTQPHHRARKKKKERKKTYDNATPIDYGAADLCYV